MKLSDYKKATKELREFSEFVCTWRYWNITPTLPVYADIDHDEFVKKLNEAFIGCAKRINVISQMFQEYYPEQWEYEAVD